LSGSPKARAARRDASPWGRLALGVAGGYAATTLLLAAVTSFAGASQGEWVNWAIIFAPLVATVVFMYAFVVRSLAGAAKGMAAIGLVSGAVLLAAKLVI